MAQYIEILRGAERRPEQKLEAAQASCRELKALERLRQPWRETYRDFRRSLRHARAVLQALVRSNTRA